MRGIIVFVKNPELGEVKTRLAQTMGDEKALEVYNKLVDYTRNVLLEVSDAKKYVFYASFIDLKDGWDNDLFEKRLQSNGSLGDKIKSALKTIFKSCDEVIIIGSDCPQILPKHIDETFALLRTNNIVIGPSEDGGYYLLGMDRYYPELFTDITWSTDSVLRESLQKVKQLKLKSALIDKLSDVDYEEDWLKFGF